MSLHATDQKLQHLLGIEAEGWAFHLGTGEIADVESMLHNFPPCCHGAITTEPGHGSIEFVGKEAGTVGEAVGNILALDNRALQGGLKVRHCNKRPVKAPDPLPTSRYRALWEATKHEARTNGFNDWHWNTLHLMKERAALQFSFSVPGLVVTPDTMSQEFVFVMNVLNMVGPQFMKILLQQHGIQNAGHLSIWNGWASPERFMYNLKWFVDFDDLRRHFESLTRLIKCVKEHPVDSKHFGEWEVDLKTPLQWGNLNDEAGCWWPYVRPRIKFGTLEVRLFPALPLEILPMVGEEMDRFFCYLVSIAPSKPVRYEALKESHLWKAITSYSIGGMTISPLYSQERRRMDLRGDLVH